MAGTFKIYSDANLTIPVQSGAPKSITLNQDGSSGNVDTTVYFGSVESTAQAQATSQPGVDQITVTVTDSAPASGQPNTLLKISATAADFSGSLQTISIGHTISGGTASAVPIYVRANITDGVAAYGVFTDLSFVTNYINETYP